MWTGGRSVLTAWLPSQETENAGACQASGLIGVCILLSCIISHWERVSIARERVRYRKYLLAHRLILQMREIISVAPQIFLADLGDNSVQRRQKGFFLFRQFPSELKSVGGSHRCKVCGNIQVFYEGTKLSIFFKLTLLLPIPILNLLIQIGFRVNRQHIRPYQKRMQLIENLR